MKRAEWKPAKSPSNVYNLKTSLKNSFVLFDTNTNKKILYKTKQKSNAEIWVRGQHFHHSNAYARWYTRGKSVYQPPSEEPPLSLGGPLVGPKMHEKNLISWRNNPSSFGTQNGCVKCFPFGVPAVVKRVLRGSRKRKMPPHQKNYPYHFSFDISCCCCWNRRLRFHELSHHCDF